MNVRALLVVVGLAAAAFVLWDGEKVRRTFTEESPGRVRIGEVVHKQVEIVRILDEIRRTDAEIERLRVLLDDRGTHSPYWL